MDTGGEIRELGPGDLDALLEAYRNLLPDDEPAPTRAELDRLWDGICADPDCYKIMLLSGAHRGAAHAFYERNGFDPNAKQGFIRK